eukprot:GEMP01003980.1.p1 GENE.GEMP01003980.1~~GEMP01003980.1.p1  ORF type:complete len:1021 (+),score=165.69 GEMP01003980.1:109-3171(+)
MRPPDRPSGHASHTKHFVGRFQIGELLGKGAFGVVLKGFNIDNGLMVAIKQIKIKNVAGNALLVSIDSEVSLLRKLNHRNIVKYLDCQRTDTDLYLILEYVEGGSLASILKKFGSFPESLCAIYIQQVLRGLEYLHDQGVVHRDIKGANTLTTKSGLVKLADFGVATKLEEVGHDIGHQSVVGTPYWMPPELVEMKPPTFACDIWSVGCTVIEMVSGSPPYFDLQPFPALFRIANDPHPPLPEGSSTLLNEFFLLCFQRDLTKRPSATKLLGHTWILTCNAHAQGFKSVGDNYLPAMEGEEDTGDLETDETATMARNMLHTLSLDRDEFRRRLAAEDPNQRENLDTAQQGENIDSKTQEAKGYYHHYHYKFMRNFSQRQGNQRTSQVTTSTGVETKQETHDAKSATSSACDKEEEAEGGTATFARFPAEVIAENEKDAIEIRKLLSTVRPYETPEKLVETCERLVYLLQKGSDPSNRKLDMVVQHGAVPILEMLEVNDTSLLRVVLQVVNQIIRSATTDLVSRLAVGLIPEVVKFGRPEYAKVLRAEAAKFVSKLCQASTLSMQMLVACGGLEALVHLVGHQYYNNRELVWLGLDSINTIFETNPAVIPINDCYRLFTKAGLTIRLVLLIDLLASDIHQKAPTYLSLVIKLLFMLSEGDHVVKVYLASQDALNCLILSLRYLPADLSVKVLGIFKNLALESSILNILENRGLIPVLVHYLRDHSGHLSIEYSHDACDVCLQALVSLCKISKSRQEQAVLAGVVPLLQNLIFNTDFRGQNNAFQMICAFPNTSKCARFYLAQQRGVAFFVSCLGPGQQTELQFKTHALEALVHWLSCSGDGGVQRSLLDGKTRPQFFHALTKLVETTTDEGALQKNLDLLVKMVTVSEFINKSLGRETAFVQTIRLHTSPAPASNQHPSASRRPPVISQRSPRPAANHRHHSRWHQMINQRSLNASNHACRMISCILARKLTAEATKAHHWPWWKCVTRATVPTKWLPQQNLYRTQVGSKAFMPPGVWFVC